MSDLHDPRVLLAAERTLMAWNRTSISLMAFGFAVERFGLFLSIYAQETTSPMQRGLSFVGGQGFILLGVVVAVLSLAQHRKVLQSLTPGEIPPGYQRSWGLFVNATVAFMGLMLSIYLMSGFLG
jgi:putative membrane protein